MSHGHNEFDMSAALTTYFFLCDLHAATVTDDTLIADALVLSAMALIVLGGTEDSLAEEAVALGLVGAIINSLRLQYLAEGVLLDFLGRCKSDGNLGEIILDF